MIFFQKKIDLLEKVALVYDWKRYCIHSERACELVEV